MIRWLIKKKQIRLGNQQPSQVRPHNPSAAHGLGLTGIICFPETQTSEDSFGFRFDLLKIRGKRNLFV